VVRTGGARADAPDSTGHIRVAARALIIRDGAVLLQVCRIDDRVVHLLPGGGQERGETLAEAVVREVREETGLAVAVGPLLWVREFIPHRHGLVPGDAQELHCVFACTPTDDAADAALAVAGANPDATQTAIRWVPLHALSGLTLWPEVLHRRLLALTIDGLPLAPEYLGEAS